MAVTRYVWAVYGSRHRSGHWEKPRTANLVLTIPLALQHLLGSSCGLKCYNDDSELVVRIQTRALEAVVVALKRDRKLKLLNFVTFTVRTDPPRAAPTLPQLLTLVVVLKFISSLYSI